MAQSSEKQTVAQSTKLTHQELRWVCDPSQFHFETTADVDPASNIVGQGAAREAISFGLECDAQGQNIYVRGVRGTGRLTMVKRLLEDLAPMSELKRDYCYVHNFKRVDRPRLVSLAAGTASRFRKRVTEVAEFAQNEMGKALDAEPYFSERNALKEKLEAVIRETSKPLEKELSDNEMALVSTQQGPITQTMIFPIADGKPIPPDQFRALAKEGSITEEALKRFEDAYPTFQEKLQAIGKEIGLLYRDGMEQMQQAKESGARQIIENLTLPIIRDFQGQGVETFIKEVVDDILEYQLEPPAADDSEPEADLVELYGVNVVLEHTDPRACSVVMESTPNLMNLLGTVEPRMAANGMPMSDFRGIRGGALLNADQGYLILDVHDLLSEPGAWRALTRTLRNGKLEIVPPEIGWMQSRVVVQPEPIEIKVRVILIGDASTYYQLDHADPDFRELFKVLADFDDSLAQSDSSLQQYASVVSKLARDENLLAFDQKAVAALCEHGARITSSQGKLTSRFGRIADIAREASFLAKKEPDCQTVSDKHIFEVIFRTKQRASLPSRKFQEMIGRKTLIVQTKGEVVGQVNGLAVMQSGPLTYGFPARITATIGPGRAGIINIEGASQMSGSIHTKGFHILGGLLRYLLKTDHPMAFSASLAFEQSYGGIDGDSASGVEMVCLLSALTGIPVKQTMAMTGAIDQLGHIQAIGGVNEKIEGFFDTCKSFGLTGDQGVVIPKSNAGDLMLRRDVVEACREGNFHVYAVSTIYEALELLTGVSAGHYVDDKYESGSLLAEAVRKANEYWRQTLTSPSRLVSTDADSLLSG